MMAIKNSIILIFYVVAVSCVIIIIGLLFNKITQTDRKINELTHTIDEIQRTLEGM